MYSINKTWENKKFALFAVTITYKIAHDPSKNEWQVLKAYHEASMSSGTTTQQMFNSTSKYDNSL